MKHLTAFSPTNLILNDNKIIFVSVSKNNSADIDIAPALGKITTV